MGPKYLTMYNIHAFVHVYSFLELELISKGPINRIRCILNVCKTNKNSNVLDQNVCNSSFSEIKPRKGWVFFVLILENVWKVFRSLVGRHVWFSKII